MHLKNDIYFEKRWAYTLLYMTGRQSPSEHVRAHSVPHVPNKRRWWLETLGVVDMFERFTLHDEIAVDWLLVC